MNEQANPLDIPGTPFEVELLNPNPTSSRRKGVPVYRLSFEVPEQIHSAFMNARESNLRLVGYLSVLPDTDEEAVKKGMAKKTKEPKGPYGQMWNELYRAGFMNCPVVNETIRVERMGSDNRSEWDALHAIFEVETLAIVSPERIYTIFSPDTYPQVKRMVEQAKKKAGIEENS